MRNATLCVSLAARISIGVCQHDKSIANMIMSLRLILKNW